MALTPTLPATKQQTSLRAISRTLGILAEPVQARCRFPYFLELWHLASLDAATIAVTWCLAFAWSAKIRLPAWLPAILGLSAWAFYITDRLLDARTAFKASQQAKPFRVPGISPLTCGLATTLQPRHYFHWKHRHLFLPAAIASTLIALTLVFRYMPFAAQTRNSVLALASLAYLTSVHTRPSLRIPKELLVAIVFTAACTLPIVARMQPHTSVQFLTLMPAILVFTALAWINCHAIETWESGPRTRFKVSITQLSIALAAAAAILAAILAFTCHPRPALLLASATASTLLIALLDKLKHHLTPTSLRTAADLALATPLVLLAIKLS